MLWKNKRILRTADGVWSLSGKTFDLVIGKAPDVENGQAQGIFEGELDL
jgi:hypothetical protein